MLYVLIKCTLNNIFIIVMNSKNKVVFLKTSGSLGFLGPKRKTPYAAEVLGKRICFDILKKKVSRVEIILKSPFDKVVKSVLKGLRVNKNLRLYRIRERITIAHNGCRVRKARRV